MTRIGRRLVITIGGLALLIGVPSGEALAQDEIRDVGYFVGTWDWTDPETGGTLTEVKLKFREAEGSKGGEYRGDGLPPDLGGPNGLGANFWEFEDGTLSFVYKKTGRLRVDDMLHGKVKKIDERSFQFKVTGGYYGTKLKGKVFVFKQR
jgi:hypothetical protein